MSKHAIVVLTAYTDWIKYMFNNWPSELKKNQNEVDLIVCIEERANAAPTVDQVRAIMARNGIDNFKVLKSSKVNSWFREKHLDHDFVEEYNMGMNILLQLYIMRMRRYTSVFFIDDDIILSNGIMKVFDYKCSQLQRHFGASQKTLADVNSGDAEVWKALRKVAGNEAIKWEDYRVRHINSGQRLLHSKDFDVEYYKAAVINFFKNEKIRDTFKIWKTTGKNKWRAFMMDQRFETLVYIGMGINEDKNKLLKSMVKIEANRPEKIKIQSAWISKPLYHNTTCTCKQELYEKLVERGEIRGIK